MLRSITSGNENSKHRKRTQLHWFAIAMLSILPACQDVHHDDDGIATESMQLANDSVIKAKFTFPTANQQKLSAPKGHAIEGSSLTASPNAFFESLTIEINESISLTSSKIASELKLSDALSSSGPAILFRGTPMNDANDGMFVSIPMLTQESTEGKNLVVVYRIFNAQVGGKTQVGMLSAGQLARTEKSVSFYTHHFGAFQVAWYSGDPSLVQEQTSSQSLLSLEESKAESPAEFFIRTPSGEVFGQFPVATWGRSEGAVSYDVLVSSNKECTAPVKSYLGVANLTRTLDGLNEGSYFLCVTALSGRGAKQVAKNNGLAFTLRAETLGSFSVTSTTAFATSRPTISWTPSTGAKSYNVMFSNNAGCSNPLESEFTSTTSWTAKSSKSDGTYYVCILATDGLGGRLWVNSSSNRPAGEGVAITIDTTGPGSFDILGVGGPSGMLTWSTSSEAEFFGIKIANDANCTDVIRKYDRVNGAVTNIPVSGLEEGKSYYACMTSIDRIGNVRIARNSPARLIYDTIAPKVISVTSTQASGTYTIGKKIDIIVRFSEALTYKGDVSAAQIALNSNASAKYFQGGGTDTWTFRYSVDRNQDTARLDYSNTNALSFGNAQITDSAGNILQSRLPAVGSSESLSGSTNIAIDTRAPSLVKITPESESTDVAVNTVISVVFSEAIQEGAWDGLFSIVRESDSGVLTKNFTSSYDATTRTLTLTQKGPGFLASKSAHLITIFGARDLVGNTMEQFQWRFTTK